MPDLVHGAVPTPDVVSSQPDFATLYHELHLPGPLGDVHVGDPTGPAPLALCVLADRGFYAVPPPARAVGGRRTPPAT